MIPKRYLSMPVVLAAVMAYASATRSLSSSLRVNIPQSLSKPSGYDHRQALFGVPPYRGSTSQNVYYADSDLCDPNVDTSAGYPIRPKDKDGKMEPWPSPYILMVDRGGCTFVQKVRNAQRSGAAGVIIADNTCLCTAGDECHSEPGEPCETREPIMADDGSGSDISILSFLMFKEDADPIKAELMADRPVHMTMTWALPSPDNRVEYELWTTPTDVVSREFQLQFKEAAVALDEHAHFTPHMYITDGIKAGCQGLDGESQCGRLCTNNGRYCAMNNDLNSGVSGADVVAEGLRRDCIWSIYGKEDGIGVEWWDYVNEFMSRCDTEAFFADEECVNECMELAGVDADRVERCMEDSGGLTGDVDNIILEEAIADARAAGVVILPTTTVNNGIVREELSFSTIFRAICSGYVAGEEPSICTDCATCYGEYSCVKNGKCE